MSNQRQFHSYRNSNLQNEANNQNEGNAGLQHTTTFIERNSWMKNYLQPQAAGSGATTPIGNTQFNANGTMVLHRNESIHSRSALDLKVNNYTG